MEDIEKLQYGSTAVLILLIVSIAWSAMGRMSTEEATEAYNQLTADEQTAVDKFNRYLPEDNTPYTLIGWMMIAGLIGLGILVLKSWTMGKVFIHKEKLKYLKEKAKAAEGFTCEVCGDKFDSEQGLKIHKSKTHKE